MFITRSPRPAPGLRRPLWLFTVLLVLFSAFAAPAAPRAALAMPRALAQGDTSVLLLPWGATSAHE